MPSSLGERIALARRHARLSQGSLAEAVGVSRPAVSQWESRLPNRTEPTTENLRAIARVTGAPMYWLADDESELFAHWPSPDGKPNQRVAEESEPYVSPKGTAAQAPRASQPAQLDDDKLARSIQFLERQFALWDREFIASQHVDLITGVYARIGRRGESNLVELSQWLSQQVEGETSNARPGGVRGAV